MGVFLQKEAMYMRISEKLRKQLLKEEFKLRSKQPEAWTKTKYRAYANFRAKSLDVPVA